MLAAVVAAAAALIGVPTAAAHGDEHHGPPTSLQQINLVSDQPGQAMITDPNLVNAWGMSHTPTSPMWVSDNGTDVATLYTAGPGGAGIAARSLVVRIPGGAPTGQAFNDASPAFVVPGTGAPATFIFISENGVLSAWNGGASAVAVAQPPDSVFKGMALVHSPFGPLLLVTDFHNNKIDIFDSNFTQLPGDNGLFSDPRVPAGFAPFNVAAIGNDVVVTYAKQDADRHDDVAGRGNGFVDVYTDYGALLQRFHDHEVLNSPWGLLLAPPSFGSLAGDLLVGNFGDGRIHAFDMRGGDFAGTLTDAMHRPITIDGLWTLELGDPAAGGADSVWFSAGPNDESHGLLGLLQPN